MQRAIKYIILFFILHLFAIEGGTQITTGFGKLSVQGKVSQSIIYCIARDSAGYIWAGTEEGVMRYNSKELVLYNKYKGLPPNASNRISDIFVDKRNRIWVGMENGLLRYKVDENLFVPVVADRTDKLNLVECIAEGKNDELWIGDFSGLWLYDVSKDSLKNVFGNKIVYSLAYTGDGVLIGTNSGLYYFDTAKQNAEKIEIKSENYDIAVSCIKRIADDFLIGTMNNGLYLISKDRKLIKPIDIPVFSDRFFRINSILQIKKNLIVIGTDGAGLIYLDSAYHYLDSAVNDKDDPNSISSNGIYDILLGKENIMWIATYGGGINFVPLDKLYFKNISHVINNENSLIFNFTREIREDLQGRIWFGTKQGLSIWDRKNDKWTNIRSLQKSSIVPDIILALEEDGDFMWVATYGNGVFKVNKKDFTFTHYGNMKNVDKRIEISMVYSLLKDDQGNVWLGGIDGDLHEIKKNGQILRYPIPLIKDILELKDGSILTAGRMGVFLINNGQIDTIKELAPGQNNLHYVTINCVKEDSKGNLILGTNGEGLVFYNANTKSVNKLNISNGMPSDIVQAILMKDDTGFWASTTGGLVHVSPGERDTLINVYNKYDGVVSSEFNYGSAALLSDGLFMFGGIDGVTMFDPDGIKLQGIVPNVIFEHFKLFKTKNNGNDSLVLNINNIDKLQLKYNENSFNIKFIGILHSSPSKVLYSWKMSGLHDVWSEPSKETQLNFVNLPPGKYRFFVKASNRDGIWSPAKSLNIDISPPWWKTTFAYLLYILLFLLAVASLVYGMNLYMTKRNAEEQINFFNSITHELKTPLAILLSTLETFPKIADNPALVKIKSTSRQLINLFEQLLNFHLVTSDNQKTDDIKELYMNSYLSKIISRFKPLLEERDIRVEVVNNWEKQNGNDYFYYDKYILDKILFNLLSNAIKYSNQGGLIQIILDKKKNDLMISVIDNGIGIPKDQQKYILKRYYRGRNAINSNLPGTGLGLMIVKSIVEKDKGSIKFNSIENKGSTFTVTLRNKKQQFIEKVKLKNQEVELSTADREALDEYSDSKILIVEDNNELRADLVDKLGTYFQVFEAENGKEGLKIAMEIFPDLIITDLIMPEMDGLEMSKALQDDINLNHIPIIMITVLTSKKQKQESVESGISTYLEKPVDYNYLLAKVINSLSWSKKLREKYLHEFDVGSAAKFRTQKDADFINTLENYILSNITEEDLSVHNLCSFVNMSRTALYMKLKNMVDLSPQNFIIHTRLKFARKKLIEGKMSVKEVAYSSGFSNPKYFSTSFKKLFGASPTTFIKNLQKD